MTREGGKRSAVLLGVPATIIVAGGSFVAYTEVVKKHQNADWNPDPDLKALAQPAVVPDFKLGKNLSETQKLIDAPFRLAVDRRFRFAARYLKDGHLNEPGEVENPHPAGRDGAFPPALSFDQAIVALGGLSGATKDDPPQTVPNPAS